MIEPLASDNETTIPVKRVNFCTAHDIVEMSSTSSQSDIQRRDVSAAQLEDKPTEIPEGMITKDSSQLMEALHADERRLPHNVTSLEVKDMDITTSDHDMYYGIYLDFQLPLPDKPQISNLFVGNTHLVSNTNSPMSILCILSLKKMYGTVDFAMDQTNGQLYRIGDLDVTPINLFGGILDEDLPGQATRSTWSMPKAP